VAHRRRLIVVSNRGPAVYVRDEAGHVSARRGGGGLVTALDHLAELYDVVWVASAMSDEDRAAVAEAGDEPIREESRGGYPYGLRLVPHDPEAYRGFYDVVANPMLWFIQHRLWDLVRHPVIDERFRAAWDEGYVAVNRGFADAVVTELARSPEAAVFFHDYHLYLTPAYVRERHAGALLAHFVHIPWVGPDYWGVLPAEMRRAVHAGLLANDLVAFHTERWRLSFVDSATRLLGATRDGEALEFEGRRTETLAWPISIDPTEFAKLATDQRVLERQESLREHRPEQLIVRVDRTDPSKNILRGLRAFELLLERYPEHHGRAVLLALLDPSRQGIPEYAAYTAEIAATAEALNARVGYTAVDLRLEDDFPLSVAAYKEYDVLFVNPILDGLNLVAKEGPLVNERDGVLVLSETAGAADELEPWALVVNPFDVAEQAAMLHAALGLPEDVRRRRLEGMREHITEHDVAHWARGVLGPLDELASSRHGYD
jgi:trehalose 6-phosphate synthase